MLDPRFPELRVHLPLFRRVGILGMSSDEEGEIGPNQRTTYVSHRKAIFSSTFSRLGWHMDYLSDRYIEQRPYDRVAGDPVETDLRINGLPGNIYETRWYNSLSPFERDTLKAGEDHPMMYHDE